MDPNLRLFDGDIPDHVPDELERIEFSKNYSELFSLVKDRFEVCEFLLSKGFPYSSYQILRDLSKHILSKEFY